MLLKDLRNKQGERLLPEEKKALRDCQGYLENYADGYNQALSDLADKDFLDYIKIDEDALHDLLLEQFDGDISDMLRENIVRVISKHRLLQSKDILKTRGK